MRKSGRINKRIDILSLVPIRIFCNIKTLKILKLQRTTITMIIGYNQKVNNFFKNNRFPKAKLILVADYQLT